MRILLVNDDGIRAEGLAALYAAARGLGERTVVAPASPQSAAGRSMTLHEPLQCVEVRTDSGMTGTSVTGRPDRSPPSSAAARVNGLKADPAFRAPALARS